MKKIYKLLILIFLFVIQINVHAEETIPITSLPKNYSFDGYEFTIEGFSLKSYKINEEDENDEGWNNFISSTPDKVIALNSTDLAIKPEMLSSSIRGIPATFVGLNFNISKEKIEEILENEGINPTEENNYISEIVVKYKLSKIKKENAYMYNINTMKFLINSMALDGSVDEVSLNNTIEQPINIVVQTYDKEKEEKQLFYETELTEDNNLAMAIFNYLALSNDGIESSTDYVNYIFSFHSMSNIDYLIEGMQDTDLDDPDNADDIKDDILHPTTSTETSTNSQVVNVANTLSTIPKYFYIISIIMITTGISLIGNIVLKK